MAQEYISTSKNAVNNMAALLKGTEPPRDEVTGNGSNEDTSSLLEPSSDVWSKQPDLQSDAKKIIIQSLTINGGTVKF